MPTTSTELEHYAYDLPVSLIAQEPLNNRVDARLMVVDRESGAIDHRYIRDLPELLSPNDHLVLNNTRVVPARLIGFRSSSGGKWQGLFLSTDENGCWKILCKTRGKLAMGEQITLRDREGRENQKLRLIEQREGGVWIALPEPQGELMDILDRVGRVPLPHYIRGGEMLESDFKNYQTVYARTPGSVAAPTAGLHFTKDLLRQLESAQVRFAPVTLHVGLDTFRPISVESLENHVMHTEWVEITRESADQLNRCRADGHRTIAVGTTSVRVLESVVQRGPLQAWRGTTDLFIRPPYQFRAVDALLTNFHLPRSTLLVLVRTFGGDELIQRAYQEAIENEYRFYSYGDAMLIV